MSAIARVLDNTALVGDVWFGADDIVKSMVAAHLPDLGHRGFGEDATALGIVRGGKLVGGVVYNDYTGFSMSISAYINSLKWATPETLHTLYYYPFVQLGVKRLEALIARNNKRARKMTKHMGFTEEGCHPLRYNGVDDAISYGMLRQNCPWLKENER